jgi:hypothetical protein
MSFSCASRWNRLVDPDFAGKGRWFGSASYEALRVTLVGNIEHFLALPQDVVSLTIVNHRWRQQGYAGVTVLFVVPAKKLDFHKAQDVCGQRDGCVGSWGGVPVSSFNWKALTRPKERTVCHQLAAWVVSSWSGSSADAICISIAAWDEPGIEANSR